MDRLGYQRYGAAGNDWGLGFEIRDHKSPHWTGTAGSVIRIYAEHSREPAPTEPTTVPLGVAQFPGDLGSIRYLAERAHSRIVSWNEYDRGGHRATHDAPDLWLNDIRTSFARIAGSATT